jgi:two-component system, OmpR family, KDP operon response regulator KdpE
MIHTNGLVLVVAIDPSMGGELRTLIESGRFGYVEAATAALAILEVQIRKPNLVLVDLDRTGTDRLRLIRRIRSLSSRPIIVLSGHRPAQEKIAALNAGADDCVSKPLSAEELLARMRAVLRRSKRAAETEAHVLAVGDIRLDLSRRWARGRHGEIHLTPLEYRVLECLARQSGFVVPHDRLVDEIWGPTHEGDTRSLRVCIRNLRKKLEHEPHRPRFLTTELGIGYRLRANDASR